MEIKEGNKKLRFEHFCAETLMQQMSMETSLSSYQKKGKCALIVSVSSGDVER